MAYELLAAGAIITKSMINNYLSIYLKPYCEKHDSYYKIVHLPTIEKYTIYKLITFSNLVQEQSEKSYQYTQ